jgi:hypothetical protein
MIKKQQGVGYLLTPMPACRERAAAHDVTADEAQEPVEAQPQCIRGAMREYQLEGLKWLVSCLGDQGVNCFLADEMVCRNPPPLFWPFSQGAHIRIFMSCYIVYLLTGWPWKWRPHSCKVGSKHMKSTFTTCLGLHIGRHSMTLLG